MNMYMYLELRCSYIHVRVYVPTGTGSVAPREKMACPPSVLTGWSGVVCMCMYKSWLQNHCLWCLQVEYGGGPRSKDLSVSSKHAVCLRVCSLVPRLQVEAAFRLDIRGEYL